MQNNINNEPECEFISEHQEILSNIIEKMPSDIELYEVAELFRIFGDCTRVKIIYALLESEMCVCAIAEVLNMTQSAISHQLRILKQARLVKYRRDGKTIYYSLNDDHVSRIFSLAMQHITD